MKIVTYLPTSSYILSSRHTHKKISRYLSESGVSVKKSFSSSQLFWGPSQTTVTRFCPLLTTYPSLVDIYEGIHLGVIQQLRGQEEGEGGQPKVHACPPGEEGGPLNVQVDQNLAFSESIS